jgi:ketosteroid isomerase-like protein
MLIKKMFFLLLPVLLFCACYKKKEKSNNDDIKAEMVAAEISFSKLSREKGSRTALLQFIDSNGVLLRPNSYPLVGGNAIDFISQANDTFYFMNWQPKGSAIAESGELGYTYGVYTVSLKNKDTLIHGTYVNIWKKQPDGIWKLVLDSGNEGIEEEE